VRTAKADPSSSRRLSRSTEPGSGLRQGPPSCPLCLGGAAWPGGADLFIADELALLNPGGLPRAGLRFGNGRESNEQSAEKQRCKCEGEDERAQDPPNLPACPTRPTLRFDVQTCHGGFLPQGRSLETLLQPQCQTRNGSSRARRPPRAAFLQDSGGRLTPPAGSAEREWARHARDRQRCDELGWPRVLGGKT
jgi:hypothetical protein